MVRDELNQGSSSITTTATASLTPPHPPHLPTHPTHQRKSPAARKGAGALAKAAGVGGGGGDNKPGLSEEEIEEIREAFNLFDTEGTGAFVCVRVVLLCVFVYQAAGGPW